ncbi:MAG: ABC-2 family transporter protein [Leptospiraceae bacterium]|nr:ABC-2 family transporter protein [Leptospiraceae bacterium]MCB1302964.1 ABC-2 family transporter protein [Leptospiraceae bacterium]
MVYWKFVSMSFQRSLAYRFEYYTALLNAFLYIFIFTSVWKALIPEGQTADGLTRETMVAYAVLSTLIKSSFGRNDSLLSQKVRSGEIAVDLMKPFSFPLMYLSDTFGSSLFQLFARAIPLLLLCVLVFGISLPVSPELFLQFLPIYLLAFLLFFLMSFLISSFSFYFVEIFPFWIFYYAMITLCSGAIIPLDFFPDWLVKILLNTPFPYLFYFPTMLLLDRISMGYGPLLIHYAVLISIVGGFCYLSYQGGLRKLSIVGG